MLVNLGLRPRLGISAWSELVARSVLMFSLLAVSLSASPANAYGDALWVPWVRPTVLFPAEAIDQA